jgi:hypothetical protein
LKRSRPPREAKFAYNPDPRSLDYRFVNARNGEFNLNDSKGCWMPAQGGLVNTRSSQRRLMHQLSMMCTFSVGIVAMALAGLAKGTSVAGRTLFQEEVMVFRLRFHCLLCE